MARIRVPPAELVVATFGSLDKAAEAISAQYPNRDPLHFTTVSKWRSRGGNVPQRWHEGIIRAAAERGEIITRDDLAWKE